jgi:hypothetical protein
MALLGHLSLPSTGLRTALALQEEPFSYFSSQGSHPAGHRWNSGWCLHTVQAQLSCPLGQEVKAPPQFVQSVPALVLSYPAILLLSVL